MGMKTTDLGKVAMTFEGDYSPEATYDRNSCVLYQNSTFVSLHDGIYGVTPSNDGVNWRLLAVGVKGDTGGYYIPSVDSNGVLTWRVSDGSLPSNTQSTYLKTVNSNIVVSRMPPANPMNGVIWVQDTSGASATNGIVRLNVVESANEPSNPQDGDVWIES